MKILTNKTYKNLILQISELTAYKKCSLNFMRLTGINPLILGEGCMFSENNLYTCHLTKEEAEFVFTEIDIKNNPVHYKIYYIYKNSLRRGVK